MLNNLIERIEKTRWKDKVTKAEKRNCNRIPS